MPEQQKKKSNQPNQPKRSRWSWLYYVVMIGLLFFFFFPFGDTQHADKNLSYTKFTAYIENDAIASITVYDDNTAKAKIRPVVRIAVATRESERVRLGVSPRGTLALLHAAQAWASVEGREFVLPDDVKAVAAPVLAHRIISRSQSSARVTDASENIIDYIIDTVPAPIE